MNPFCWVCFVAGEIVRLNDESRCPLHGLVLDRVLGIVQVDVRLLHNGRKRREGRRAARRA